ncbi:MAG: carbamoyl-phosphate synthase large subunit [Rhodothermales bacterium]|jgi:carbamoyl-phosphate synthase large subunit
MAIIGISGINAVDNPGPGVGVARSLKEADPSITIHGLAYDAMEPGIYLDDLIDRSFAMPYPSGQPDAYLARLIYIKQNYGLDLVIPNLDAELPFYVRYADRLAEAGIRSFLPSEEQFKLRSKDRLQEVADGIEIDLPETRVVSSVDGLIGAIEEIGLPVMVKGSFYKAYRAYTTQEAISHYHHIVAEWGYPIIVQEVVTGDELNVVGLGDGEGNSLGAVGMKKIWVTDEGKVWTGVTIRNEPMLKAAEAFVRNFKWRGPFELECLVDGDTIYLIEINPRFPAWVYLSAGVGVNLPGRLRRHALGDDLPELAEYPAGKLFVRYTAELVTDMTAFQNMSMKGETP